METNEETIVHLKRLVKLFQVRWQAWPEYAYVNNEKRQIGYELELAGTDPSWGQYVTPGNKKCEIVFEAMHEIADWIIPSQQGLIFEIEPHENAITYWSRRHNRPDVLLNIKILHRDRWDDLVNESQDRALAEMETRLSELGARGTASLVQAA